MTCTDTQHCKQQHILRVVWYALSFAPLHLIDEYFIHFPHCLQMRNISHIHTDRTQAVRIRFHGTKGSIQHRFNRRMKWNVDRSRKKHTVQGTVTIQWKSTKSKYSKECRYILAARWFQSMFGCCVQIMCINSRLIESTGWSTDGWYPVIYTTNQLLIEHRMTQMLLGITRLIQKHLLRITNVSLHTSFLGFLFLSMLNYAVNLWRISIRLIKKWTVFSWNLKILQLLKNEEEKLFAAILLSIITGVFRLFRLMRHEKCIGPIKWAKNFVFHSTSMQEV